MRFNTNRVARLAFENVADLYTARPDVPTGIFDWAADRTGLSPSQVVLEIGAGAGQLTRRLLEAGASVLAVEPGKELSEILRSRFPNNDFEVFNGFFEECHPSRPVDAIWSANAFHWTDPDLAVPRSSQLLDGSGSIALIWTFLLLRDAHLGRLIADGRLGGGAVNFGGPDTAGFIRNFERSAAEGRDQLTRGGLFVDLAWEHQLKSLEYPAGQFPDLALTFANTARLDAPERERLHQSIHDDIVEIGLASLTFEHHAYAVTARPRARD